MPMKSHIENLRQFPAMAPRLSEDEVDDVLYLSRVGDNGDLSDFLNALAEREKVSLADILITAKNEAKSTGLHMAAGNGHLGKFDRPIFAYLTSLDMSATSTADHTVETVRTLLQCFDGKPKEEKQAFVDEANEHGNTGLHWAALGGHLDTVKLLMEHGASPALANESNYVPLDLANLNDKREVAQFFLSTAGMLEDGHGDSGLATATQSIDLTGDDDEHGKAKAA